MKIIEKDDWKFSVDVEKTKEYYKTKSFCECSDCRNFYAQVEEKLPKLKEFLSEFGVDILRPDDIFSEEFKKSIGYWYMDYTVCGKILISGRSDIVFYDNSKYKVVISDGVVSHNEQTGECFTISFRPFELPRVLDELLNPTLKDRIFEKFSKIFNKKD